ncbi:unnamed protein product, partial [Tetraodon nigroviridis]
LGGVRLCLWARGACCGPRLAVPGRLVLLRAYCAGPPPPSNVPTPDAKSAAEAAKKRVLAVFWAEAAFMVARAMVREAHAALEALQVRLKEIRDRLDRVSREEAHYLELATLEHKLLQVCWNASLIRSALEILVADFQVSPLAAGGTASPGGVRGRRRFREGEVRPVLSCCEGEPREGEDTSGAHQELVHHGLSAGSPDRRPGLHLHQPRPPAGAPEFTAGSPERPREPAGGPESPGWEPSLPAGGAPSHHPQPQTHPE